jgi:transposase, IS5 family
MRKRFEAQLIVGQLPIEDTPLPKKTRDSLAALVAALREIFVTPEWNEKVFSLLEDKIISGKKKTGRPGMNLWQIFVLAQVRFCLNISYDRLHMMSNYDKLIRQLMGVETDFGYEKVEFEYQNILDNISLLDDETVKKLNDVIVSFGHSIFKKKETEALRLKTDSFVTKSNVHFPTDYNLLWDCARKSLDMVSRFLEKYPDIPCWRKIKNWKSELKNMMRTLGRASVSGGKDKEKRLRKATQNYIKKSRLLAQKTRSSLNDFPMLDICDLANHSALEQFIALLEKHIDLLERRLLKGEVIPHEEKMFSIFETYTEWITKGKQYPNVELGKNTAITTDQYHLIVDYMIMESQSDSDIVPILQEKMLPKHNVVSWSFDRGFFNKLHKINMQQKVEKVVMPKKGKRNQSEDIEEADKNFKRLRCRHSAIESNINELEHRGLDYCPDKGYGNFKRYVGLAVCAYNLRRIGKRLLEEAWADEAEKKAA